jgi:uncharacterized protein GlcG (DUF336 family)
MKTKFALTFEDVTRVATAAKAEADAKGWAVSIAILDDGGNLLLLHRLDGAPAVSPEVATAKGRSAALFRRPTKALEEVVAGGRVALLKMPVAMPLEGGVPLVYRGEIVGGIGVSGVQSFEDATVAMAGAAALGD